MDPPFILAVLLTGPLAMAGVLILGAIAVWVLKSATLAREPAFSGFCLTLGSAMAGGATEWTSDQPLEQLAALAGTIAGLWLLWRWRVRPERAARDLQQ